MKGKYIIYFKYFYKYLRFKIFVSIGLNISVGVLDGFGLIMFLPLLKMVEGENEVENIDLGGMAFLVDWLDSAGVKLTVISVLVLMFVFFTFKGIARFLESFYKIKLKNFFITKLRFDLLDSLGEFSYKSFVNSDSGKIQNTLSGEIGRVVNAYNSYFLAFQGLVMVAVYTTLAFLANPQFAILVIIGGLASNYIFDIINEKTINASRNLSNQGHDFQGLLIQKVANFKYLKATGSMSQYITKLKKIALDIEITNQKLGIYGAFLNAVKEPLIIGIVVLVIIIQITLMDQNMGLIILSLLFFFRSLTFLMNLQTNWNGFLSNAGALENLGEFQSHLLENKDKKGGKPLTEFKDKIELKNVRFGYGNKLILNDIELIIKKNQTIALVGESGGGKTTLINILTGLIPIDKGSLTIDDISYSDIDMISFQKRIGYVTQDPVIFSDTLFNNVTFWDEKNQNNLSRFHSAMKKASLNDFFNQLENKEETILGQNGILVSGGQKQRISIARELYKNIDLLIMDEATSALDSESEKVIQENIENLKGKITLVIVAHRLSTIKNVDCVILLSKGEIIASDGFKNLVKNSPAFKRMVDLQTF